MKTLRGVVVMVKWCISRWVRPVARRSVKSPSRYAQFLFLISMSVPTLSEEIIHQVIAQLWLMKALMTRKYPICHFYLLSEQYMLNDVEYDSATLTFDIVTPLKSFLFRVSLDTQPCLRFPQRQAAFLQPAPHWWLDHSLYGVSTGL